MRYLSHGLHRCRNVVDEIFLRHFLTDIAITPQVVFGSIQQLGSWRCNFLASVHICILLVIFLVFTQLSISISKQKLPVREIIENQGRIQKQHSICIF